MRFKNVGDICSYIAAVGSPYHRLKFPANSVFDVWTPELSCSHVTFGAECVFPNGASVGPAAVIGPHCVFGHICRLGEWTTVEEGCTFGSHCVFGQFVKFGHGCKFGAFTHFDPSQSFARVLRLAATVCQSQPCTAESIVWDSYQLVPENLVVRSQIFPKALKHWARRLATFEIDISGQCYDGIAKRVLPHLDKLMSWPHWLPFERQVVESWARTLGYVPPQPATALEEIKEAG